MICDLQHSSPWHDIISDTGVYCIPCNDYNLKYIYKMLRNIHKHLYKHKRNIRVGNLNIALLQHISKSDHNFDLNATTMLAYIHNKSLRQIFGVSAISFCRNVNNHPGFFSILLYLGKLILNRYNIFLL